MGPEIVFISLFMTIFGIIYVLLTARHKENMNLLKLIELDKDITTYKITEKVPKQPTWMILVLNVALLAIGIGVGILVANILHFSLLIDEEYVYPPCIFIGGGIALLTGIFVANKIVPRR